MSEYYENNAREFFDSTVEVDMSPLYERFLPLIPSGGSILDAGCGSGRDSLHFIKLGYEVTAMDASQKLCELAGALLAQPVECLRFDEISWQERFDAVWACASLLHVPKSDLESSFQRLSAALKPGGVMYASFKYGDAEREKEGRHFTDLNESSLQALVSAIPALGLQETWVTSDRRPCRAESWLNVILRKQGA